MSHPVPTFDYDFMDRLHEIEIEKETGQREEKEVDDTDRYSND